MQFGVIGTKRACRKVYLAALASLLMAIATGLVVGYPATALVNMDKESSSIHLSTEAKSWFASVTDIGEIIGCLLAAPISEKMGRRRGLIVTTIPFVVGWTCIILSKNFTLLIVGRVFTGICSGISMAIVPTYLIEISSPDIRGLLGASFQTFFVFGILLANVIGWVLPKWEMAALCSCMMPVISACLLIFMPESPRWLVSKDKREEAIRVIEFLHGSSSDPLKVVAAIQDDLREQRSTNANLKISEFKKGIFWKPTILSLTLMFYKEVSGICIFLYFTVEIFKSSGTTINSNLSTIIVSTTQTLSTLTSSLIMDRAGRRILLTISAIGMSLSLGLLGGYFFLKEHNITIDNEAFNYIPLLSLICYISFNGIGYGPIPWMMMNELSPLKARSVICGLTTFFNSSLAFLVTKTFVNLQSAIAASGVYWTYGVATLTSVVFVWCFLPETKGKPLEDILEHFSGKRKTQETQETGFVTHM